MVGDGPIRSRLERQAPDGVTFFGRTSEERKFEVLRRAHLLLFPAVREGWGLTVLEANSQGTPVVGYDVPGLRDSIRPRETGELVTSGNPAAMGDMAAILLIDGAARERMARNALSWASKFSWERTAEGFLHRIEGTGGEVDAARGSTGTGEQWGDFRTVAARAAHGRSDSICVGHV